MPVKKPKKRAPSSPARPNAEVLDVRAVAELLTVSTDTVYDLLKRGELPGRKVGRKWLTTRNAVLRWIESSSEHTALARAIEQGDQDALMQAFTTGKARVKRQK